MKQSDLIFDVGLHRGEDTDFYLRKGFRVVAFEADPDHVSFCRERFKESIQQGRLTIVEGAIVDPATLGQGPKRVSFYKNEGVSVWGTVRADWVARNEKFGASSRLIEVEAIDFAANLKEHGVPHYLKIDIEGCDLHCVRALKDSREQPDYLSIESDKTSLRKIKAETDLLSDLGYSLFQAVEQSSVVAQSPPFPPREGGYVAHRFEEGSSGLFGAELEGRWESKARILRRYRLIRLGYCLVGENGLLIRWRFRGAGHIVKLVTRVLERLTGAAVPGWYDTHACLAHSGAGAAK
jgi:FkbM family methyltransferase